MSGYFTEIQNELKSGVDSIKLFPRSAYDPNIISTFKASLPYLNVMLTGAVSLENMEKLFKSGSVSVGVGGKLLLPSKTGEFAKITNLSKKYMKKLRGG